MFAALWSIRHRGLVGVPPVLSEIEGCMLGHVRLPIQGVDAIDAVQPITTGWGTGVFVGEVLNFKNIAPGLLCDTPLAVSEWLTDPVKAKRWEGFWALATVDRNGVLSIGVDYLGQKPLYIDRQSGIIASEMRAIFAAQPRKKFELDSIFLANTRKWGYDPTGRTPYASILRVTAGTEYKFGPNGSVMNDYDDFKVLPWADKTSKILIRAKIESAVKHRLVADVPVAVLCSGGLDSTIVALLAAKSGQPITVFHVENEEAEYIDQIRWPSNVDIRMVRLDEVDPLDAMLATEEPVDLGSVVPQYALAKAVHDAGFRVCLTGDGADELFGGYGRAARYDSQASDVFCELMNYHMPRLDKCMMSHGVELRSPYLSKSVVELALSVPYELRRSKELLKELFCDIVPPAILERKKKPLKTRAVKEDPEAYRNALVDDFVQRHLTKEAKK